MHPRDADLWKRLNSYLSQTSKAWGAVSRNISTDQSQQPPVSPPLVNDHGLLAGLVPTPDSVNISDYNDDHTQYPLIFGRPGGQYIYGSRPGAGISWVPAGPVLAASSSVDGTSIAHAVGHNVVVNNGIVLVASSGFNPETGVGETNYHTSVTDTGGNTWTKLKEFTVRTAPGSSAKIVSLWFCLVTSALTTASGATITVNYSTAMDRHAAEAYQFTMSAGLSVTLVSYVTDGTVSGGENQPSLSLSGLTGESLFVRAMAVQPNTSDPLNTTYTQTGSFTKFDDTHAGSTLGGLDFGFNARGEFRVLTASGTTSAPILAPAFTYTTAAVFGAIQIVAGSSNAYLRLGGANLADASTIELTGGDLRFNAGIGGGDFIFDPLGEGGFVGILDFDAISGSNKTFVFQNVSGTLALLSDITALGATYLKLDASNDPLTGTLDTQVLRPSTDNTYDIGDTTHFYKDLYLSSDIIPKTDGVMDIGTITVGMSQEHYAYPASSGVQRTTAKGMLWEDATLGDVIVGADGQFGYLGYYGQVTTKANSSVSIDFSETATNFFQGAWGNGANPIYPFIELNYQCGSGAVGLYSFGEDGATFIRRSAVTMGVYNATSTLGGGGLLLGSRGGTSSIGGCGAYLHFDEANARFNIRTMSAGSMAAQQISQIGLAGTRLTKFLPVTDAAVDLGITLTNAFKNCFLNGFLELEQIAAVTTEGDLWNDSTSKGLSFYGVGIRQFVERSLFSATASATVANTTTETTLVGSGVGTATLPTNFFVAGRTLRIKAYGHYGTQLTGAANLQIKVYLGTTAIGDTTSKAVTANLSNRYWELETVVTCRTTGATGTVFAQGAFTHDDALVNFNDWPMGNTATTTVDTTAAQAVSAKATWGAGVAAADTITCTNFTVEALN